MPGFLKSNCCTSSQPPSPECLAPRPVAPIGNPRKCVSKDHIPSVIPVGTEELRAIFEEAEVSNLCLENHVIHRGSTKLRDVLETDKYDSDKLNTEGESDHVKTKKSSNTLKTVTERLKKHLSKDGGLSKRHSRSSVGTSEEEIERRAELRRIRERRPCSCISKWYHTRLRESCEGKKLSDER